MRPHTGKGLLAGVLTTALATAASAGQPPEMESEPAASPRITVSANVGAASDFAYRGRSWSSGQPIASGGLDVESGEVYAGLWTANVRDVGPGDGAGQEVDAYIGWRPSLRGYDFDLAIVRSSFVGLAQTDGQWEAAARLGQVFGPLSGRVGLSVSPDYLGRYGRSAYAEGGVDYRFARVWTVSAQVGRQAIAEAPDYWAWGLGLTRRLGDHVNVEARYVAATGDRLGEDFEPRLVLSLKAFR